MKAERWKQIKTIYQQAVETAPERRGAFVAAECGADAELRREVEDLLRFETVGKDFIEEPAFSVAAKLLASQEANLVGKRIDHYEIRREIGRGGMGAVYLAERSDGLFEQRVALKIIKRGMDSDAILKRFVMERQILAQLEHPNIAHLVDGGTTDDGLPYFVMEYVEGEPVDRYCERENLGLARRLELFRKICGAVSYAHQNLVVHRDLKPSNILVTAGGEPKLLDFGIAKLLHVGGPATGETQATETVHRLLTPEYASPEQFRGERVTTQSDVYSLGVLLKKLIFGNAARQTDGAAAAAASSTQKTGVTGRTFERDLRAILQTALRDEPQRRYPSVEAFSEDLRRLLAGLPVLAQKDSPFYRVSKFAARHAAAVSLSALAVAALLAAAVFSFWQAQRAGAAQARAERRFNDVRKLARNVLFEYHGAIEDLPNSTAVREKMLKDSLEYLDSLSAEATDDKELLRELGAAYEKVGTIQGNSWFGNLNDTPAMLHSYQKSFEIRQKLVGLDPGNDELRREFAIALENLGDVSHQTGDLRGALERYERARVVVGELAARDPKHLTYLARLHSQIAHVQGFPGEGNLGETENSMANYRRAVEIMQRLYEADPTAPKTLWGLSVYRRNLANILLHTGDVARALEQATAALNLAESWIKIEPDSSNAIDSLTIAYGKLADIYAAMGDLPRAVEFQRKAIAVDEPAFLADPKNRRAREVAIWYYKLGDLYVKKRDFAEAEKWHLKALPIFQQNYDEDPSSVDNKTSLADAWFSAAAMYKESGRLAEAREFYEKALKFYEDVAAQDAANQRVRADAALALVGLGDLHARKNEPREALAFYEKALPVLRAQADRDRANALLKRHLDELQNKIAAARGR